MKEKFPFIAVGIGGFVLLIVLKGKELGSDGSTLIPLLTLLAINEIAFILTAAGAYLGLKQIKIEGPKPFSVGSVTLCFALAITFTVLGIDLFPETS